MKTIVSILALIFFCINIKAQNTWITMLPDTGNIAKMIRTNDGKFLAVSTIFDNGLASQKVALCKINNNGQIEWYKSYDLLVGDSAVGSVYDVIQLSNSNIIISGEYDSRPFIMMTNNTGDTIWCKRYLNYTLDSRFLNLIENSSIEFWALINGYTINPKIHKFDMQGNIIEIDSSFSLPYGQTGKMIKISTDTIMFIGFTYTTYHFYYYNNNLTSMLRHVQYNIDAPLIIRKQNNTYIIHEDTYYNPQNGTYNGKGLVCLSANLDSLFKVEFTQYYYYSAVMHVPNDMQLHTDNGLVMCGSMWWNNILSPYFMVLDSTYHYTVIKMFSGVIPDRTINIFEELDSGFVMSQDRTLSSPKRMFVIKVNNQGNFSSVENNEYFIGNSLKMLIFPNPTENKFTVRFSNKVTGTLNIYNLNGMLIKLEKVDMVDETNLYLDSAPKGIYIVSLLNEQNKVVTSEQLIIK